MAQEHPHRDVLLTRLCELGPVGGDAFVHIEQVAIDERVGTRRGHPLDRRVGAGDRVGLPLARPGFVRPATPQVDDLAAVNVRADACSNLALLQAALEHLDHLLVPGRYRPVDRRITH